MFIKAPSLIAALTLAASCPLVFAQSPVGEVELDAKTITVSGVGHQRSFACEGRKLILEGSNHVITTTGICSGVEVSGTASTVDVTLTPNAKIMIEGAGNVVRWKSEGKVSQNVSGAGNQVTRVR